MPVGLCRAKKLWYVATSGGPFYPQYSYHYLRDLCKMAFGIPETALLCSALSYLGTEAPHVAAAFVRDGGFDFAGFGRTVFAYPDFANDILHGGMKKEKCSWSSPAKSST